MCFQLIGLFSILGPIFLFFVWTELGKLFPSIPLVAEEDSSFLRLNNLVDSVVSVVNDKTTSNDKPLKHSDILAAIDRGGKNPIVYGNKPATYWVGKDLHKMCSDAMISVTPLMVYYTLSHLR